MTNESIHTLLSRDVWCILGLPFDAVTLNDAANHVRNSIETGERCFISTPNLNFAVTAQSDEAFFESVVQSDISLADGMPIVWLAKLLGIPLRERVAGSDLFSHLSEQSKSPKIKVFFFGGQPGVAAIAHEKLNQQSKGMESCGYIDPGFVSVEEMSRPDTIQVINQSNADFLVVALGAKKGQQWIQHNKHQFEVPVYSHLGAVINFVAGHVERAPGVWQKAGLEWLWRIRQEPALWRRYLGDALRLINQMTTRVLPLVVYSYWLKKSVGAELLSGKVVTEQGNPEIIRLSGAMCHPYLQPLQQALVANLHNTGSDISLDMAGVSYIDGACIAKLLLFQGFLKRYGRALIFRNTPKRVYRLLKYSGVTDRFEILSG
ncbi:WecB/TagA/CpsF family glycosyltransferase [Gynuella sunshinyii]|uniref:Teichoic acid biosynthesis protein n=1 Tax=Gynuella sunshinyii YC6258 TaxID=1445510 RepID=A0A0C5VE72_9GAMM|nr:WecB/TagA/CpsF family glycosyltransferase [Gynuella sunshinyii]AJQ92812.1 teichoic acid biosynthesis protein [Gynuella sunshinyii YC6258]